MTFTVAITRQLCSFPIIVTLSGPALTYGLDWVGMLLLRSSKFALFAYALIFASFAPLRFIQTLTGHGDELVLAQQWCCHEQVLGDVAATLTTPTGLNTIAGRLIQSHREV